MDFGTLRDWATKYDLLVNRVGIVNEMLGCNYHISDENPMIIAKRDNSYSVRMYGEVIVSFRHYDNCGLIDAIECVELWHDVIWSLQRNGRIKRVHDNNNGIAV